MSTYAPPITAEQLLRMPDDGMRHELVEGQLLVMPPPGIRHGRIGLNAGSLLSAHVRANGLGVALGEAGFVLATDPDTVRAPDAAFIRRERAEAVGDTAKYWPGAPDLAIEVVSPDDRPREVAAKAREWVAAGATAVLVLDPADRAATVHRAGDDVRQYEGDADVDLSDAVPGWQPTVAEFFA
jgi:Uma2 family endonuclease